MRFDELYKRFLWRELKEGNVDDAARQIFDRIQDDHPWLCKFRSMPKYEPQSEESFNHLSHRREQVIKNFYRIFHPGVTNE